MLRMLCAALLVSAASAAGAATLAVESDQLTYQVGETITLTVFADDEGEASSLFELYGRLRYDPSLADPGTVGLQLPAGPQWTIAEPSHGDGFVDMFNQITLVDGTAPNLPAVINTATLIAEAVGIVTVEWDPTFFEFFDLASAPPGTSFTIVPEPATGALLALGLLALGIHRGRERISCEH